MPLDLKPWELKNIQHYLMQHLQNLLRDSNITAADDLKPSKDKYILEFAYSIPPFRKKNYSLHLRKKENIDIHLVPNEENRCKLLISSDDLMKLHQYINQKIINLMNLYFTGESVKTWEINIGPLTNAPKNYPHKSTTELRLFQVPLIAKDPEKLAKLKAILVKIVKEITDYEPKTEELKMPGIIVANATFGGMFGTSRTPEKGRYLFYSEYTLEKLLTYHFSHFPELKSVEYWIKNAFDNSTYTHTQYHVIEKLETQDRIKYTMIVGLDYSKELPKTLLIMLDKWRVLIKIRYLVSHEKINQYKLSLSAEAVEFLHAYFYKRICDSLVNELRPEIKASTKWLFYKEEDKFLISKVCLAAFPEYVETRSVIKADILSIWKKLTEKEYNGCDKLPAKSSISGQVEIIKSAAGEIIGILFSTISLTPLLQYYERFKPLTLYLSPSPSSLPDPEEDYRGTNARAFNGEALNQHERAPSNDGHVQFTDIETQSALSYCLYDPEKKLVTKEKTQEIFPKVFPKSLTKTQLLQFFNKRKTQEPVESQISEELKRSIESQKSVESQIPDDLKKSVDSRKSEEPDTKKKTIEGKKEAPVNAPSTEVPPYIPPFEAGQHMNTCSM